MDEAGAAMGLGNVHFLWSFFRGIFSSIFGGFLRNFLRCIFRSWLGRLSGLINDLNLI